MIKRFLILVLASGGLLLIQGCAPLIVAGGATAAVAASERRTLGSFVDDETIEIQARKSITDASDLGDDVHVNITSMNGVVLLSGEATTAAQRDQVVALVRPISGIRRIVNEIQVATPEPFASRTNDSWITGKVKARMLGIKDLEARQVKVVTENSVVYLMGLVTRKEGDLAAEAAREVSGVQRVVKMFEYID